MDDHIYSEVLSYAECDLIPRFQNEYEIEGALTKCPSYEEVKDLCTVLTIMGKWAGYGKVRPSDFIEEGAA